MSDYDSLTQNKAFSIEEIYGSDITDEENKLIIEFMRNMVNERNSLPNNVNIEINVLNNNDSNNKNFCNKTHNLLNILNKYTLKEKLDEKYLKNENKITWKSNIVEYINRLRYYIHKKYNRNVIDTFKYNSCNCSILSSLQKDNDLIQIFSSQVFCVHLYIYGINYKQIIYYIDIIANNLNNNNNEANFIFFLWLIYLLILLDSLQALDSNVSSNLQIIKRFCINKIENPDPNYVESKQDNFLSFLKNFYCTSKNMNNYIPSYYTVDIFYVIYIIITDIFNQK